MNSREGTIRKTFQVETENLFFLPKGYRFHEDGPDGQVGASRTYPLVTALHGMGMSAGEFAGLLEPLRELPVILFVPEGVYPFEIRTAGRLRLGHAWYLYTGDDEEFVRSMRRSGRHLRALTNRVEAAHRVDPSRRFLLGFSQGGYFAGYLGIKEAARLRGLAVIGARIKDEVLGTALKKARDLEVLLLHGKRDRAVPFTAAEQSRDALLAAGIKVDLHSYTCGHHITPKQVRDLRDWLKKLL